MASKRNAWAIGLCAGILWVWACRCLAQVTVAGPDGSSSPVMVEKVEGGSVVRTPRAMPSGPPGVEPSKPGEPSRPGMAKGPPGAEKGKPEEKKPPAIQRPTTPPKPPDPNELKVKPDKLGKWTFNFKNQPWQGILEWLADNSGMSLDWQEVPGDYLNLTTPPGRSYTVRETRDLINRHLLARGYTLLSQGSILSVVGVSKLNPAMVPRVDRGAIGGVGQAGAQCVRQGLRRLGLDDGRCGGGRTQADAQPQRQADRPEGDQPAGGHGRGGQSARDAPGACRGAVSAKPGGLGPQVRPQVHQGQRRPRAA